MRTRLRSKATLLFIVCAALLSVAGTAIAITADPSGTTAPAPTIQSDKDLYTAGDLVTLTGSGWQAGESVNIVVNDDAGQTWNRNVNVTADQSGNITDSFNLPEWFVATYSVRATGASGAVATTSFSDPSLTVLRGPTGNPPGGPGVTFTVDWKRYTNSTCSTAATSGGNLTGSRTVNSDAGNNLQAGTGNVPPGAGGFVKITAPQTPTSPTTYTFDKWVTISGTTLDATNTSDSGRSICVLNPQGGDNHSYRATYKVANQAPTVSNAAANASGNEGTTLTTNGAFSDQDGDTLTITKDSGVGTVTPSTTNPGAWSWSLPTTDDGSGTVVVKADDEKGGTVTDSFDWSAGNVEPNVTSPGAQNASEGFPNFFNLGSFTDPGDDGPWTATVDWGDGSPSEPLGSFNSPGPLGSRPHVYTDNGDYTVTVTVTEAGSSAPSGSATFTANVANVPPIVSLNGPNAAGEGSAQHTYNYTVADPGQDTFTTASGYPKCGTGGNLVSGSHTQSASGGSGSFKCTFPDGPANPTVAMKVEDSDGAASNEATQPVNVTNLPPTIGAVTNNGPINEGQSATISAGNATDPAGANDPLSYSFDCNDDGDYTDTVDKGPQTSSSASCSFADNGSYTVNVRVSDGDGGSNTGSTTVTVNNVPPTINSVINNGPINEGQSANISVSASDPAGANDPLSYEFDCKNDGTYEVGPQSGNTNSCSYNDDGTYTVKVRVTDDDGGSATDTTTVTVNNVEPNVTSPGAQGADEGTAKTFNLGSFADPGDDGPWTATVNWGDGSGSESLGSFNSPGSLGTKSHTYADNDDYTVTVTVTEAGSSAPSGSATFTANVANLPPKVNLTGLTQVNEGDTETYSFTITDPGADTFSFVSGYPTCGQNGQLVGTPNIDDRNFQCHFPDGATNVTTDVAVKVQDDDNGVSVADTEHVEILNVQIANVDPTVTAPGPQSANEAMAKSFDLGTFTDPGTDSPWSVDVDWGDGSTEPQFTVTDTGAVTAKTILAKSHTYADNGTYTGTITVTDKNGASDTENFTVNVTNLPPTIDSVTNSGPINEGQSATITVNASDPAGANDPLSYSFDCNGDNDYTDAGVDKGPQASSSASCSFADNGSYNVNVRVSDNDGGEDTDSTTVTVNNVAPTFNGLTASSDNVLTGGVNKVIFKATASDVPADPITYQWSGGDAGSTATGDTYKAGFLSCGDKTVTVTASDGDGGQATLTKTVKAWNALFQAPIKDGTVNTSAKGQVVPVKVTIGCGTTTLTTLQPVIQLLSGDATPEADSGTTALTVSVSSADSGLYMRPVDAGYIYNLQTPSAAAGTKYTIRVNPWGAPPAPPAGATPQQVEQLKADWNLATGMYALLQIRK